MKNLSTPTYPPKPARRYDIDWLRVLAVLMLIPFHTARIFDVWEPFYAKNAETSVALSYTVISGLSAWHMPLFFLLAGASTWFALGFRGGKQYVAERFKRLLLPLVFGLLVIVPPQAYLGALTYGYYRGSYGAYYPQFFQIGPTGDLTGYMGGFTPGHLWFILFLFVLSLAGLPLFLWLKGENGQQQLAKLANFLARPGLVYLAILPLVVTLLLPDLGGKNPFYYFVLFAYGYILMANQQFSEVVNRHKRQALVLGPVTLIILLALSMFGLSVPGWVETFLNIFVPSFVTWCCLISLVGYGRHWLNFTNSFLRYASEGAYPFYILHQTVVVGIGYFLVQMNLGIGAKFWLIGAASLLGTALVYELLVRRFNVIRFLMGMKPRQKAVAPQIAVQPGWEEMA